MLEIGRSSRSTSLEVISSGDADKAAYFLDWGAHMFQRPTEKPGVALVLRGGKGTGKTMIVSILTATIGYRHTLITADGKSLFKQFNWHLADKLLIVAEEAFFAGNRRQNDQLKHLLTGSHIELEQKFGQKLSLKSAHRLIMTSNHDQVVAASNDERRFVVYEVSDHRHGDMGYFAPLAAVASGRDKETLAAFIHALLHRDITGWNAEAAARKIRGGDLARQKRFSLEPPLQWLWELAHDCEPDKALTEGFWPDNWTCRAPRNAVLGRYREWTAKSRIRGAEDFAGAERFWASVERFLNPAVFPGAKIFSKSGTRYVTFPGRDEVRQGFARLLGNDGPDDQGR